MLNAKSFSFAVALFLFCTGYLPAQPHLIDVFKTDTPETIWTASSTHTPRQTSVKLTVKALAETTIADIPADVLILIDHSSSMMYLDSCGTTMDRLHYAHAAARTLVDSITSNDSSRVAIKYFWGLRSTIVPPDPPWIPLRGFTSDRTTLQNYLDNMSNAAGTFLLSALDSSITYMRAHGRPTATKTIIVLTDGQYDGADHPVGLTAIQYLASLNSRINAMKDTIKVYTVGLGSSTPLLSEDTLKYGDNGAWINPDTTKIKRDTISCGPCCLVSAYAWYGTGSGVDTLTLKQISASSGTKFYYSRSGAKLNDIYTAIAKEIRSYAVARVAPGMPLIIDKIPYPQLIFGSWARTANNTVDIQSFDSTGNRLSWEVPQIKVDSTFEVTYTVGSNTPGWNNLYTDSNFVNYVDASNQPGKENFPQRRVMVVEPLQYNAIRIISATALDYQRIRLVIDTAKFLTMGAESILIYQSTAGYVENAAQPHFSIPARTILANGGTYTVTGLAEQTTYYYTVSLKNFVNETTALSATRGATATTLFRFPTRLLLLTSSNGDTSTQVSAITMAADTVWTLYAAGFDNGVFVRNYIVAWTGNGIFGGLNQSASSYTIDPTVVGTGRLFVVIGSTRDTCMVTVQVGRPVYIRINDGPNNGNDVGDQTITTDITRDLWSGAYDADSNFIRDTSVSWSVDGTLLPTDLSAASGKSTSFHPTRAEAGYVKAVWGAVRDSFRITVIAGNPARVVVRDGPNHTGNEVDTVRIVAGYSDTFYLAAYDVTHNYLGDVSGTWASIEVDSLFRYSSGAVAAYVFTPLKSGRGRLTATFGVYSDTTGLVTVVGAEPDTLKIISIPGIITAGVPFNNVVVEGRDQLGNLVTNFETWQMLWQVFDPTASVYGYTVEVPDAHQIFAQGQLDSSSLNGQFRFVNSGTNRVRVGVVLPAGDTLWSDYTNYFLVNNGAGFKVEIRDTLASIAPRATPLPAVTEQMMCLYAGLYDTMGNYISAVAVGWYSTLADSFLATNDTLATHIYLTVGQDTIVTTHNVYVGDSLAVMIRDGSGPVMLWGYNGDGNGDGYMDSFTVYFSEDLHATTTISGAAGFALLTQSNTITLGSVALDSAGRRAVLSSVNSGAAAPLVDGGRVYQDGGELPRLVYNGSGTIRDIFGNSVAADTIVLQDRIGPVVARAEYTDGGTDGRPDDDVLKLWFSEPVKDSSWQAYVNQADSVFILNGIGRFGNNAVISTGTLADDNYLEVRLGSQGQAVVPGGDSLKLVPGRLADRTSNPAAANNQGLVIHMTWGQRLLFDVANYPNPFRAGFTGPFNGQNGVQEHNAVMTGFGPGSAGTLIKYTLNRAADVNFAVYTNLGMPVLKETYSAAAAGGREGVNYFYWSGANGRGRLVGTGTYILVLKVVAADGTKDKVKWKIGVTGKK
jgi:Mg-chelatase subunit ChlD